MANEPSRITDNLLNIFNYSFVETVPYEFFKPRRSATSLSSLWTRSTTARAAAR